MGTGFIAPLALLILSQLPASATTRLLVLFPPHTTRDQALSILTDQNVLPLRTAWSDHLWLVEAPRGGFANMLHHAGALVVLDGSRLPGCGDASANIVSSSKIIKSRKWLSQ